jgi:hypothetical protein
MELLSRAAGIYDSPHFFNSGAMMFEEIKKPQTPLTHSQLWGGVEPQHPCTACGGDASVGYGKGWDGKVKKGERLCTPCFQKRGGVNIFAPAQDAK